MEDESQAPIDGVPAETMLNSEETQSKFSGYYSDGKATPEAVTQIERIMVTKG